MESRGTAAETDGDGVGDRFVLRVERSRVVTWLARAVFGDRLGLTIFLGVLCVAMTYWRVGIFITDSTTLANALIALGDGQLVIEQTQFGGPRSPGMHIVDGRLYARNYGQVAVSLPVLWVLVAASTVADLPVVLAAVWSLLVIALCTQFGIVVDRPRELAASGAVVGLLAFVVNLAVATPLSTRLLPVIALQITTLVATALLATLAYRLLAHLHGRRVGVAAGLLTVFGTPIGFWASIPKRHVFTACLVFGMVYVLYRSRAAATDNPAAGVFGVRRALVFRASAYSLVGLLTWIHAGEGLLLFVVLLVVDLPTAPSNDLRTLTVLAGALLISLLPFFLTNALISGDPVRPPRMLSRNYEGTQAVLGGTNDAGSSTGGTGQSGGGGGSVLPLDVLNDALEIPAILVTQLGRGLDTLVGKPEDVYRTFVRGGYIQEVARGDQQRAIYLTVFESTPIAAGLVAIAVTALSWATVSNRVSASPPSVSTVRTRLQSLPPARVADTFVTVVAVALVLFYQSKLPLHAQVTVRYLLPLYPLLIYGVVRQHAVRRLLQDRGRLVLWSTLGGVLLGSQLLLTVVVLAGLGVGEAFQLHALLGLGAAGAFGAALTASTITDRVDGVTAVALGVTAALAADFVFLAGVVYFDYGQHVLPVVDLLAERIAIG